MLLLSVLVPKPVEKHILNFATGIVLSDHMKVLLGLVPADLLSLIDTEHLDQRLQVTDFVLFGCERVVE